MDNLRWLLLGIGLLVIAAIYLIERYKRRRRHRAVDRFFDEDESELFSIDPNPIEERDYSEALADLGELLARNRDLDDSGDELESMAGEPAAPPSDAGPQATRPPQPAGPPVATAPGSEAEAEPVREAAAAAEPERIVILYLKSSPGAVIGGTELFRGLHAIDMTPGAMGIYHDLGADGRPVFSAANMFEPGTLDVSDRAAFQTRGLALFMCLPGPADEQAAFDRMLSKARRLAENLGAVLHDERHQPLTAASVDRVRKTLQSARD